LEKSLQAGRRVSGFLVTDVRPLDELKAIAVRARHEASGAEVFHILNNDEENLFAFAFATPPEDSTGVAHILEHSVLCGSKNHPLKDAFLVLAQGSLQTFLNAMTYPDKTVYPASSTNATDYFNLMAVYGDAVFRPLLAEWTFLQEGRRFEFKEDGSLDLTGVVYNEMKGAYSSLDSIAGRWAYRSIFAGTPYEYDSGGDPDVIPDLDWKGLKAFHAKAYAPANCRVFLCGNISTERQLEFLNDRFFSKLPVGEKLPAIPKVERWSAPRRVRATYPAVAGAKSTVLLSWLCADATNGAQTIALAAMAEILLGHDGSPLSRALVESRLGEDIAPASGIEADLRETAFVVGLRGVASADADKVESLVLSVLERLVAEGVAPEDIEAAIRSLEFSNRELRRSGGPYSLAWMTRSLRGWLHGAEPWETLLFAPRIDSLKKSLATEPRFFEGLIKKLLLDNQHRVLLVVDPEEGLNERKDAELRASLDARAASLTKDEKETIRHSSAELARVQAEADSAEALATIPHLSRADLSRDVENIPRRIDEVAGFSVIAHDLFTNGIGYVDFAFPADILDPADYLYLPLLSRVLVASGLPGMDWGKVSGLMARTTGGFYAVLQTSSLAPGAARSVATPSGILDLAGRDWVVFRLKALEDQLHEAIRLARRLITEADFTDRDRLRDLIMEYRNDFDSSLAPGGHSYAAGRAGLAFSRSRAVDEIWGGLTQLQFAHTLSDADVVSVSEKLAALRDRLAFSAGLLVNITGSADCIAKAETALAAEFAAFGVPRPRSVSSDDSVAFFALTGVNASAEVHSSSSLQVGFGSLAYPSAPFAGAEQAAEIVLAHRLSTGSLWEEIRMKGGAYGAFAYPDGLEPVFTLATYRDPSPDRSLDAFRAALNEASSEKIEADELEKAVIGTYSKETRPRSPVDKGFSDFMRLLYGIEDSARKRKLSAIVDMESSSVALAARRLARSDAEGLGRVAVVAGGAAADKAAAALGCPKKELPV
ncbi:MAG: insulinase family protein, partial [Treponemataceae bacterium]